MTRHMISADARKLSLLSLIELGLIYSLVQAYIWRWQQTYPQSVWLILLLLLASHLFHRDTLRGVGFQIKNFFPAMKETCWTATPLLLLLVLIGILSGRLWDIPVRWQSAPSVLRYILWGTFQQYGLQGYFHNRLSEVISRPVTSSAVSAMVFMSFHVPNPALMTVTLVGGFACSMLFLQSRNVFVLGLFHGAFGLLISNVLPREWLPNMRVGPGYFR
ncbi:MAG: CPBP family intramembrane metalloprotease [Acidimicrobiia bacterium]|nr:CPBP family intramembrane metalloprotease [Acidimicrobiia bacterium]